MATDKNFPKSNALKNKKLCSQTEKYFLCDQTLKNIMVTKIIKVQQDSSIFIFGHYKCPIFIFGEWSWEKLLKILYILSIFILKDQIGESCD